METANQTEALPRNADAALPHPELEPITNPKRKNRALVFSVVAVVALGVSIGAYKWWEHATSVEETDDATISGKVHRLSSRVSGTVTKILVDDNQHVKNGQLLLQIDPKDFLLSLESAKAAEAEAKLKTQEIQSTIVANERQAAAQRFEAESSVSSATAGVDRMKAMLSETELGVALAKTAIKQREAELTRCIADYERYQSLVQDRAATRQSFDKAKQDRDVAEANLQASIESLKQAKTRVAQAKQAVADAQAGVTKAKGAAQSAEAAAANTETTKRNLNVQQATVKKAKSEYDNALTQLSYTQISAPVTGRVGHKTIEIGQQIERGQALMSIVSDEKWVVANFKETQLSRMRPGQKVEIKIDAFPNKRFAGHVDSISPASGAQFALLPPDNATGNFTKVVQRIPVKIVFEKASIKGYEDLLAPGMSVIPEVHVAE